MLKQEYSANIPNFSPDTVFRVATLFDTLPRGQKFEIKPETDADRFAAGTKFRIQYAGAGCLRGCIKEYVPGERIVMEGESRKGNARLWTNFTEDWEHEGTTLVYGFSIKPRLGFIAAGHALMPRLTVAVTDYADLYIQNMIAGLNKGWAP